MLCLESLPDRALFNVLDPISGLDQPLDVNAWGGDNVIRVQLAGLNNDLSLGDGHCTRCGNHRVEVAGRVAINQVPVRVCSVGVDQATSAVMARSRTYVTPSNSSSGLPSATRVPHSRSRVERRNAGAASAETLGECALRRELDLKLPGQVLLGEQSVLTDIRCDDLPDLARLDEDA